jgi:hypothetical protein
MLTLIFIGVDMVLHLRRLEIGVIEIAAFFWEFGLLLQ